MQANIVITIYRSIKSNIFLIALSCPNKKSPDFFNINNDSYQGAFRVYAEVKGLVRFVVECKKLSVENFIYDNVRYIQCTENCVDRLQNIINNCVFENIVVTDIEQGGVYKQIKKNIQVYYTSL